MIRMHIVCAAASGKISFPRPLVNIVNGGKHAGGDLRIQEFMIVPAAGRTFKENLRIVTEVCSARCAAEINSNLE